jgi:hypothetical protein
MHNLLLQLPPGWSLSCQRGSARDQATYQDNSEYCGIKNADA